jgi:hypothetical protein
MNRQKLVSDALMIGSAMTLFSKLFDEDARCMYLSTTFLKSASDSF